MNKKYLFSLLFLLFAQFSSQAITKEEYLKEFQELDRASPEHACLEEHSFDSCADLMYEFGKPIYLDEIRKIVSSSKDIAVLERYLHLERKLPIRQRSSILTKEILTKLRAMGTKDALFVAYQSAHNLDDLEKLANKIGDAGSTGKHELMRAYYIHKVKNINHLPQFFEKFSAYKTRRFKEKALEFSEFGKKLTIDNFFDSIEYKYVLDELGYMLKHRSFGQQYNIVLTPNGGGKEITFTFNSKCHFSKNITRRENVGFLEIFGTGGASEKDVSYSVDQCSPLQSQDKNKIYNLYANVNLLSAFNVLKNATWEYKTKTGQTYIARKSSAGSGGGSKSYCFGSGVNDGRDRNMCMASATKDKSYCFGSGVNDGRDRNMCMASATGDKSYCFGSGVDDGRERNMCMASATGDKSYCFGSGVNDGRDRNMCMASATKDKNYCFGSGVNDGRDRNMCLAQTQ
jgi:hypothetical protein